MKIINSKGKNWVVEYLSTNYPGTKENPVFFASPIWLNDNNKLEIRRAGADMYRSDSKEYTGYSEKEILEIKESIKLFIDSTERFCKGEIEETKRFKNILANKYEYEKN